jgi:hypothetical protein
MEDFFNKITGAIDREVVVQILLIALPVVAFFVLLFTAFQR